MSTRACVTVKIDDFFGENYELNFYQHCDGYPEGLGKTLRDFVNTPKAKNERGDIEYFARELILYANNYGRLAPAICIHTDIQYHYVVDCKNLKISFRGPAGDIEWEQTQKGVE